MLLTETAPAAVNPIPLREMAAHLRMASGFSDDGSEDSRPELYLRNATGVIERRTSKALITRSYLLQVACWNRAGHLHLPIGPVASIDTFEFIRTGSTVTLDPAQWVLEPGVGQQRVTGTGGAPLRAIPHGALANLTFTAGFGQTWNAVPDDLRQAVLMLATHYYENRAGDLEADAGLPFGVASILSRYQPARI